MPGGLVRRGVGVGIFLLAACGGPSPPAPGPRPAPAAAPSKLTCPLPVQRGDGRIVPRRIRLVNESPDTVDVWIDRCFWHTRLATIPPGRTVQPRLPERLVAFPEGLRFHANTLRTQVEFLGTFTLPLDEVPVLELVVSDETTADPASLQQMVLDDSVRVGGGAVLQGEDDTGGYTALFALRTSSILSWACGEGGRRHLTLSVPGRLEGPEVTVRARIDEGEWQSLGPWPVQSGPTDAVVAPDDLVASFTARALAGRALDFVVTEGSGSTQAHAFDVADLGSALAERACWAELAEPGRPAPD